MNMPLCEVCEKRPGVAVCAVPAMPLSCSYCQECLNANAHPWKALAINTSLIGGLANAGSFWVKMVDSTCKHLGRTREEFLRAVAAEDKAWLEA